MQASIQASTTSPTSTAPTHDLIAVAPYQRVSSAEQRKNRSIETQRGLLERWLAAQSVSATDWYSDDGVSGTVPFEQRPDGKRLLADIQAGRVRYVLVTQLSRFGRNAREILVAVHAIEQAGGRLISLKENIDTRTTAGRFFLTVLAGVSELERSMTLERSADGMADRLLETTWMGGHPPYGYRVEGKKQSARLVVQDAMQPCGYSEADVVRLCWHLLVEQDKTTEQIAARLTDLGIPTRSGRPWAPSVLCRLLVDDTYAGVRSYRTQDGTTHQHAVPAILTAEQIAQARAALASHRRYSAARRAGAHPYLLRGLVYCAACGEPVTTHWSGSTARPRARQYTCATRRYTSHYWYAARSRANGDASPRTCIGTSLDADQLEAEVWADVEHYLDNPAETLRTLAAQQQSSAAEQHEMRAKLAEVQAKLDVVQQQRDKVVTAFRLGAITQDDLAHQLAAVSQDEAKHRARREGLAATLRQSGDLDTQLATARTLLQRLHAQLHTPGMPPSDALKREVITTLVRSVRLVPIADGVSARGKQKYRTAAEVVYCFTDPASREPGREPTSAGTSRDSGATSAPSAC